MPYRRLLTLALLLACPTLVWAQFTTFIPPHDKTTDSVKAVVVAKERAKSDSIVRMQLTNMKAWVDSAAGVAPAPTSAADSLARSPTVTLDSIVSRRTPARSPVARPTTRPPADSSPTLRNGARAPATASDLPLLALIGAAALAIGTVLLAGTQLGRDRA
jgi:hypothetical protein